MTRTLKLFVLGMAVVLTGPALPPPQSQAGTERVPIWSYPNRFPRWLTPTVVEASYAANFVSRVRGNGVVLSAVDVDSRNVVHMAGLVDQNTGSAQPGPPGQDDITNIVQSISYWNSSFDTRRNNGFSMRQDLDTINFDVSDDHYFTDWTGVTLDNEGPELCVGPDDRVHVVWGRGYFTDVQIPLSNPIQYESVWVSNIYYGVRALNGTWSISNISNAVTTSFIREQYFWPQVKVGSNGVVHIVCNYWRQEWMGLGIGFDYSSGVGYIRDGTFVGFLDDLPLNGHMVLNQLDQPVVITWGNQMNLNGLYYATATQGGWGPPMQIVAGGNYQDADIAIDPFGNPHFLWTDGSQINYRGLGNDIVIANPASGQATVWAPMWWRTPKPRVLADSRGQIHVLYSGGPASPAGLSFDSTLFYAARIRDPQTGNMSSTFTFQGPIASPNQEAEPMPPIFGGAVIGGPSDVAISKNDQIHVVGLGRVLNDESPWGNGDIYEDSDNYFSMYTRTMEYNCGVRDPASMIPAFPGASVNVTNGNIHANFSLFATQGVGPCQAPSLVYNSLEFQTGLIAPGWRLNYESFLVDHWLSIGQFMGVRPPEDLLFGPDCLTLFLPDGRAIFFRYSSQLGYHVADDGYGFYARIERQSLNSLSPTYLLTTKHGEEWTFNTAGKLTRVQDYAGNALQLEYSNGRLTEITDQAGRTTDIEYETGSRPRIQTITDPANKTYVLNYTGAHLTSVNLPEGVAYGFVYGEVDSALSGERINLLREYITPRGHTWTCKYLIDNRLTGVEDPPAALLLDSEGDSTAPSVRIATIQLLYSEPGVFGPFGNRETVVTNPRGHQTKYVYESRRSLVLEIHDATMILGIPTGFSPIVRAFDVYGNLTSQTNRWGVESEFEYYASHSEYPFVRDNIQSVSRGGGPLASFTYTADEINRLHTVSSNATGIPGGSAVTRITTYNYDSFSGQVSSIYYPEVTLANGQQVVSVVSFQYEGPGSAVSSITEAGQTTYFLNHHVIHGLPTTIRRAGANQWHSVTYDVMGNVTSETRPQGGSGNEPPVVSVFQLDDLYRVTSADGTSYDYDADSNVISATPPAGSQVTYSYDARGFLSGGIGPEGGWSNVVDAGGNLRRVTNNRGFTANMNYDSLGRVTASRAPASTSLSSGGGGGPELLVTNYTHDIYENSQHRRTITFGDGLSASRTTTESYDSLGRVTSVLEPDGVTLREFAYNELGQLLGEQVRYDGVFQACTVYVRDELDRVYGVRRQNAAIGESPTWTETNWTVFNGRGHVVETIGPRGNPTSNDLTDRTVYTLDFADRVVQVSQPYNGQLVAISENVYGDDDLLIESRIPDPTGATENLIAAKRYTYTSRKEPKTALNANNVGHSYTYGAIRGQVDTITDALGRVTKTTYHPTTQRVNEVIEAWLTNDERKTVHTWTNGLLSQQQVWNPQSQMYNATFNYFYDKADRLERVEAPGVSAERFTFTAYGQPSGRIWGQKTETKTYNDLGLETATAVTGAYSASVQKMYDGAGNLTQTNDGTLRRDVTWDEASGRPESESFYVSGSLWKTQGHGFDEGGNCNLLSYPDPSPTNHEWIRDDANRIIAIRVAGVDVSSMSYNRAGLLVQVILRDDAGAAIAQTDYYYDTLGRRTRAHTVRLLNLLTLSDIRWVYDNLDRVTEIHYHHTGLVTTIGYNARGEVVSETTGGNGNGQTPPTFTNSYGGSATGNQSTASNEAQATPATTLGVAAYSSTYTYDSAGNRISQTVNGVTTTFTYDAGSRLTAQTASGVTVEHEYDEWGNEVERTTTEGGTTTVEMYAYNYMNRLSGYVREVNSSVQAEWQYDFWPTGERYGKTNLATDVGMRYIPNGDNVVGEYSVSSSGQVTLQNTYAQGLGLDQKAMRMPASGERIHYVGDMVGTLAMTVEDDGSPEEQCIRNVWGQTLAGDTNNESYGFAQREVDMESGLVHMRHRNYDPRIGRFTQIDPIQERKAAKHYLYASGSPVKTRDPWGLQDEDGDDIDDSVDGEAFDPGFDYDAYNNDLQNHSWLYRAFWGYLGSYTYTPPLEKDPVGWHEARVKQFEQAARGIGGALGVCADGLQIVAEAGVSAAVGGIVIKVGGKVFQFARGAMLSRRIAKVLEGVGILGHTIEKHGQRVTDGYLLFRVFKSTRKVFRATKFFHDSDALEAIGRVLANPDNMKQIMSAAAGTEVKFQILFTRVVGWGWKKKGGKTFKIFGLKKVKIRFVDKKVLSAYPIE